MAPPKAMPPPYPSSSGSESDSSTSSSDGEEQQQQQQQKEVAQAKAKASLPPVKKKPVVPKQQQKTKLQQENASPPPVKKKPVVPKDQEKTKPQQETASPPPAKKKPASKSNKKPPPPPPVPRSAAFLAAAADDDSSGDEEASDSPPKAKPSPSPSRLRSPKPSSTAKPISSSKPEEPTPAVASQQLRTGKERKRQRREAEDEQEGDAAVAGGPTSKKPFQRVWMVEDEIALLEGMLDFQEKHGGARPVPDIDAFSEFISAALQREFSKTQLYYKIRRLRSKYERNLRRGKMGADPSFAKPHEQAAFELSKKVWPAGEGDAHNYRGGDDTGVKIKDRRKKMGTQGAGPLHPRLTEAISLLEKEDGNSFLAQSARRALGSLKPTEAKALEDRWNKHFITGAKYFMERARLKKELLQSLVNIVDTE